MTLSKPFRVGDWAVDPAACRLSRDDSTLSVEPRVMDLLVLLATRPGEVLSKDEILSSLWSGVTVGEDTLARAVSRLRKALGDDPKAPRYLETIPKRGYRLIAEVAPVEGGSAHRSRRRLWAVAAVSVVLATALAALQLLPPAGEDGESRAEQLTTRADDFYIRFTRADNEAAIALYEQAIAEEPSFARAQAGLANALVQRVVRWPHAPGGEGGATSLGAALAGGLTETPEARELLARALALAERAVRVAPEDAAALKALGFVYSAQHDFDRALLQYEKALEFDENAWAVLINLGEIHQLQGEHEASVARFEQAYAAMERRYDAEPQRIGPWHAPLGVVIAQRHAELGRPQEAEIWYRRVLALSPLEPAATAGLAGIVAAAGDTGEAQRLCAELVARIGPHEGCADFAAEAATD